MKSFKMQNGKKYVLVFRKSIRKNGKVIYPKKAKAFKLWVLVDDAA